MISHTHRLTLSQSSAVGVTTPILMSLYAFRTAHAWLSMSKEHAVIEQSSLPTPLQCVSSLP